MNIPLSRLPERLDELPRDRAIVVHCASGYRSSIAASLLLPGRLHAGHGSGRRPQPAARRFRQRDQLEQRVPVALRARRRRAASRASRASASSARRRPAAEGRSRDPRGRRCRPGSDPGRARAAALFDGARSRKTTCTPLVSPNGFAASTATSSACVRSITLTSSPNRLSIAASRAARSRSALGGAEDDVAALDVGARRPRGRARRTPPRVRPSAPSAPADVDPSQQG